MEDITKRADEWAQIAHDGQARKGSGEPYVEHSRRVAAMVRSLGVPEHVVAAALLHDVLEDTDLTYRDLDAEFGLAVAELVLELTDVYTPNRRPSWNREMRKKAEAERYRSLSAHAKLIKICDVLDNAKDARENLGEEAEGYLAEKRRVVQVLLGGRP